MVSFVKLFGTLRYQNDHFWELATELVLHNFKRIQNEHIKLDLLRGYAAAKRGSDEFWKYTVQHLMEESDNTNTFFHEPLLRDITLAAIGLKLSLPATLMDYRGFKPASMSARMEQLQGALPSTTSEDLAFVLLNHPECSKKHADLFEENIGHNWKYIQPAQRVSILKMFEAKGRPQYFEASEQTADDGLTFGQRIQEERARYEESLGPVEHLTTALPDDDTADDKLMQDGMYTKEEYAQKQRNQQVSLENEFIKHYNKNIGVKNDEFEFEEDDQELMEQIPGFETMSPAELADRLMLLREKEKKEFLELKVEDVKDGEEDSEDEEEDDTEVEVPAPTQTQEQGNRKPQFQFNPSGQRRDNNKFTPEQRQNYKKQQQQQKTPNKEAPTGAN